MIDFKKLQEWENAGDRCIEIKIDRGVGRVWIFDYDLLEGQVIKSVDEIDIEGAVRERELAELKKLSEKYETE